MPSQDNKDQTPNQHAAAADLYGSNVQKNTPDQRELEAHVLLKSAKFLADIQNDWANLNSEVLEETLKYNRQIWMMFYDTALENAEGDRPDDLRSNIINLANFIFKREIEILSAPEKTKLNILISINRDIAAGLMEQQKNMAASDNKSEAEQQPAASTGSLETSA